MRRNSSSNVSGPTSLGNVVNELVELVGLLGDGLNMRVNKQNHLLYVYV